MYKLSNVVDATGVPAPTLLSWADRGFIPAAKVGRGNRRAFSLKDIDRIGIIAELTRVGLPISEDAHAVRAFSDESNPGRRFGQLYRDGAKTILLVSEDGVSVVRTFDRAEFEDAMVKLFSDERSAIVLNINEVTRRVDAALRSGNDTPRPPAGAIFRHGKEMHVGY